MTDAAIIGTMTNKGRFKDGTIRFVVDVSEEYAELVGKMFFGVDMPVAIARLTQESSLQQSQQQAQAIYGAEAKALRLSSFFRTPDVWRAIGTDAEFLAWLRLQPCCFGTTRSAPHAGDVVAAHVRRVSEGAGTGIKPPYCAIPLCDSHHQDAHQHGDSMLGDRDWWDRQRIEHVQAWAWSALKSQLGYEHWNQVPPHVLIEWAVKHGVQALLPGAYRSAA